MSYLLSWKIVLFFFRIFIKEVKGLENISRKETHIITGNHNGYADGGIILYLFCKILNQKIYFFAAKLWYSFIYLKLFECITEGEAVKKGLEYLNKKQSIAILPEGRRNKTNIIKDKLYNHWKSQWICRWRNNTIFILQDIKSKDSFLCSKIMVQLYLS